MGNLGKHTRTSANDPASAPAPAASHGTRGTGIVTIVPHRFEILKTGYDQ